MSTTTHINVRTASESRFTVTGEATNNGGTVTLNVNTYKSAGPLSDGWTATHIGVTMTRREAEELRDAIETICDALAEAVVEQHAA